MKRSELQVGDVVYTRSYGTRATVVDLGAWEKPTGWSLGWPISDETLRAALDDPLQAGYANVHQAPRVGGQHRAGIRRKSGGGSTILVQTERGDYQVASLASVRLAEDVDAERQSEREQQRQYEERVRADRDLIAGLPKALQADRSLTYGTAGQNSRIQAGRVSVDLKALRELIER